MQTLMFLFGAAALLPQPKAVEFFEGLVPTNVQVRYETDGALPAEGYRLRVAADGVTVRSATETGRFYALKTLEQLREGETWQAAEIEDAPAFRWRGVLIDEGRHFMGKEAVKRTLDAMADYKFNVLHWHLTEDQGWRIDIPGMPELVKHGSVRPNSPAHGSTLKGSRLTLEYHSSAMSGEVYGPFYYTEADLREVVAYAAERHITVVPEVDVPGHMYSALAAYPNLACCPEEIVQRQAWHDWGITKDVLCVGNDETVRFLDRVFDFLCDVFPSKVIHIGGDECPRVRWEKCPKCRARMEREGLRQPGDLQAWLVKHLSERLAKRGRRVMGWDEILAGDVPKSAIGQSWRTRAGEGAGEELVSGAVAAAKGFDMVMSPHGLTYYAYSQGLEEDPFARAGSKLTLEKAYSFDPMDGVPESAREHVLGGQCCLWTEYIWNFYDLSWRMWPRAFAMAEILWSAPAKRDFAGFCTRAEVHRHRLIRRGYNAAPLK